MDVSKHLEKAAEAVRKKNFDYAIGLYHQVLVLKPDHGEARRELRQALLRRAEYKKVGPAMAALLGMHHRIGIGVGKMLKKPDHVVRSAEGYLRNAPRSAGVNRALAEALERAGHRQSAIAVWEFLGDDAQLGDYALKRAGALYYSLKQMEKALGCYETVLKRSPRDSEAEKMRKNLAAEGVLSSGSYDPTRSSRDLARDKDQQRVLEAGHKIVATEDEKSLLLKRLTEALAGDPGSVRARRELVDHHVKNREYAAAIAVLEAGLALDADSYELRERLGDVKILQLESQIRTARARASKGDAAAETDLIDLGREKLEFEVEEFTRRVADHPTDLGLRFRLGQLLLEHGAVDRAVESFQHAVKDPRRRIESLIGLGRAFEQKGLIDLARKQLEQALEGVDAGTERATEITYFLACLAEKAGDADGARARFESIYERDIHYRDVGQRLDALREKRTAKPGAPARPAASDKTSSSPVADAPAVGGGTQDEPEGESSIYGFKD